MAIERAADADELPRLLYDAHAARLPGLTELAYAVREGAVLLEARAPLEPRAESHLELQALQAHMARLPAAEAHEGGAIAAHEGADGVRARHDVHVAPRRGLAEPEAWRVGWRVIGIAC